MGGMLMTGSNPAGACTCPPRTVAEHVEDAAAVYVARPRRWDFGDVRSFRVLAVLKGPERANLRVEVERASPAACGTSVSPTEQVVTADAQGDPAGLTACTKFLEGPAAVEQAEQAVGSGRPVSSWRPDPVYVGQWLGLAVLVIAPLALVALVAVDRRAVGFRSKLTRGRR